MFAFICGRCGNIDVKWLWREVSQILPWLLIMSTGAMHTGWRPSLLKRKMKMCSQTRRCDLWGKNQHWWCLKSSDLASGIGIIVRNHRGSSIAGASQHGSHNSAIEVEADAALRALQLVAHLRLQNIVIERDCQDIIKALNSYPLTTDGRSNFNFHKNFKIMRVLQFHEFKFH